jgi:hydrogenase nickel incorporation protein HypA/HybF
MHELALARAVLDVAREHADGRPVESVEVRVGALRQVVPDSLAFAFGVLARDTPLEGARLRVEQVPVRIRCAGCAGQAELDGFPLACPACGSRDVRVIAGEEFVVQSLEVCDGPLAAGRR